jgi:arylsulfatase A-like enzyme
VTAQADDAIQYVDRITAIDKDQPFFVYYVPGAAHAPHQLTPEWIKKISGMPPWELAGTVSLDPARFPYELYDLSKDFKQDDDVAAKYPDKLKELERLFCVEARQYQVLPLDASVATQPVAARPNLAAGRTQFTRSGAGRRTARPAFSTPRSLSQRTLRSHRRVLRACW